jgi:FkbM family methyltransferase
VIDPEFAFLRQVHRPDWVVADIGAAIGQFTLFTASLHARRIHAFEPSGSNVAMLRRNVIRNGCVDRVTIHQLALSDHDGESAFGTTDHTWVSHLSERIRPGDEIVPVRMLAGEFDRLGIGHVSVLKINVAGHEPGVLQGAETFLAAGRAGILILLLGLASLSWYEKLASFGYRFFYYHPLEKALHEIRAFDQSSVLGHRPWPARHIIGIHHSALGDCLDCGVRIG